MNFYQSDIWKYINQTIYKKPLFELDILGNQYFGIVKSQKKFGKTLHRYMVHGIQWGGLLYHDDAIKEALQRIQRDYGGQWGDIFFQCGSTDILDISSTSDIKDVSFVSKVHQKRIYQRSQLRERYSLQPSRREHMPNATILIDLTQTLPEIKTQFSSSGKRYLNKANREDLHFSPAEKHEWEVFREIWYAMAYDKGFTIVPKIAFIELMEYVTSTKQGTLLLAKKDGQILSGNVLLFLGDTLIYLYGATDRSWGNIGSHYWLMYETMRWARDHHFSTFDLLGVAPPGEEQGHDLEGVTRFKQTFGGTTVSYVGNYDLVFNTLLYRVAKGMKR